MIDILENWELIITIMFFAAYVSRNENRQSNTEKEVSELKGRLSVLESDTMKQLSTLSTAIARIEGRIETLMGDK
jgi:hypothetical protein